MQCMFDLANDGWSRQWFKGWMGKRENGREEGLKVPWFNGKTSQFQKAIPEDKKGMKKCYSATCPLGWTSLIYVHKQFQQRKLTQRLNAWKRLNNKASYMSINSKKKS